MTARILTPAIASEKGGEWVPGLRRRTVPRRGVPDRPRGTREDDDMSRSHPIGRQTRDADYEKRIATLERELAEARQMINEQRAYWPQLEALEKAAGDVTRLVADVVVSERDELKKQLAAVTAERDALLVLRNRWMAPAPPTGTKP